MEFLVSFLIVTVIMLNLTLPVTARYCTFEVDGDLRYYICPRNEYCCNFGCCLSPTFQFYQLWYYWLMVIFMFLLCSGGGWWYRYWLQGRYGPELSSSMPASSSRLHPHHLPHRPTRVTYHPSRGDAVVLHHIWKPRGSGAAFPHASPPPSYACAQQGTSNSHSQEASLTTLTNMTTVPAAKPSPYYQLYGPPPPYEMVVSETMQQQQQQSNLTDAFHQSDSTSTNVAVSTVPLSTSPSPAAASSFASVTSAASSQTGNIQTVQISNSQHNQHSNQNSNEQNL